MTIPSDVAERIEKLIPLLGSDNDGEALGAARAIERTLRAAGLDFHALAASIRPRTVWRDAAFATPGFNYANEFRQAQPTGVRPDHPDALSPRFCLCLYTAERVESWMEVGRHCLELDRKTPKRYGGRSLRDFEIKLLTDLKKGSRWPTNTQASWLEAIVARCHQARDADRRARGEA
jgi:hypothetical protein